MKEIIGEEPKSLVFIMVENVEALSLMCETESFVFIAMSYI